MKKIIKAIALSKAEGFTLIELLIVIALLGALAVGLLAALDPFEQLKKGSDTGLRNTVSEIQGAVIRYYAIKSEMPWVSGGQPAVLDWADVSSNYSTINVATIIAVGELKADFSTLAGNARLRKIRIGGSADSATVCFSPDSKSFRSDPNTKYSDDGIEGSSCQPNDNPFTCYWCVK